MSHSPTYQEDFWQNLRQHTGARIALGKAGSSISTEELLKFQLAHAQARDAVHTSFNRTELIKELKLIHHEAIELNTLAKDRQSYLLRPDWGKVLNDESKAKVRSNASQYDISLIIGDGLSAQAIHRHIPPLFKILIPKLRKLNFSLAPISLVKHARVAISDEIGEALKCRMSIIFIGERPGLSSADSLGIYLTYSPVVGNTDEKRNCISNVRPEGMPYIMAAEKLTYLINESIRKKISGVQLKDDLQISLKK
ncbi:ethanolamine ammonia-lyase small subunit [Catalinimonas alkaloidigena]|uniref:ethanolamine ammonia-lyase subunit EutC n=1 Tax=Catalinimonas alkaloidigena TaxID=1075417 RepID=UPI0024070ABD|nr:ethanolamine ammonia-lyase subunit EutC [Catalinimonas alkaloidigena]MDF9797291.1 ethanolamine ammonia-lyase small subunit [Catalinimonas alkaloidigena]